MDTWLRALSELERDGEPCVLVTVVTARGSTPREAGCKMVVTAGTRYDTIGGGNLEFTCVDSARRLLRDTDTPVLREFPLGPELGQCCGGHVSVLFEPMRPAQMHVALFGAGHVGKELVPILQRMRVRVTWIDTRADLLADAPSGIVTRLTTDPAREVASLPAGTLVLVMTHDHQIDFDIVAEALPRPELAGVGLIGSATKRARFVRRLARAGLAPEAIDRLICPIGIPGAGGKPPFEIAISVAAQILLVRQRLIEQPRIGHKPTGQHQIGQHMIGKPTMPTAPATPGEIHANRARLVHKATAACGECGGDCASDRPSLTVGA